MQMPDERNWRLTYRDIRNVRPGTLTYTDLWAFKAAVQDALCGQNSRFYEEINAELPNGTKMTEQDLREQYPNG